MIAFLKNIVCGIILGATVVIPGLSTGTMAVVLNIFDKILLALDVKNIHKNLLFLVPLGFGCLCGIFLFSKVVTGLLNSFDVYIDYCFIGIIIGCLPMIYKRAKDKKVKYRNIPIFLIGFSFMIFLMVVAGSGAGLSHAFKQVAPGSPVYYLWLFFAAATGAAVVILPGISGAVILILFGIYRVALGAISSFYLPVLFPVAAGVLTGGVIGIVVLKKMLKSHPQTLYFAILGLIVGSIFSIFPGFTWGKEGAICIILAIFFASGSYFLSRKA